MRRARPADHIALSGHGVVGPLDRTGKLLVAGSITPVDVGDDNVGATGIAPGREDTRAMQVPLGLELRGGIDNDRSGPIKGSAGSVTPTAMGGAARGRQTALSTSGSCRSSSVTLATSVPGGKRSVMKLAFDGRRSRAAACSGDAAPMAAAARRRRYAVRPADWVSMSGPRLDQSVSAQDRAKSGVRRSRSRLNRARERRGIVDQRRTQRDRTGASSISTISSSSEGGPGGPSAVPSGALLRSAGMPASEVSRKGALGVGSGAAAGAALAVSDASFGERPSFFGRVVFSAC